MFDKFKELKQDYEKNKTAITLIGYALLIGFVLLYVNLMPKVIEENKTNNDKTETVNINILEKLEEIKDNYREKITITQESGEYIVDREVSQNKQVGEITKETKTTYIFDGNLYYIIDEANGIEKVSSFNEFDNFDTTFTKLDNIKKLIDSSIKEEDLEDDTHKIKRYTTTLSELLIIYNNENNTLIGIKENKNVNIDVKYNEKFDTIEINLTDFYTSIGHETEQITYKFEYSQIGEINLESIDEIIKLAS